MGMGKGQLGSCGVAFTVLGLHTLMLTFNEKSKNPLVNGL